MPAIPPMKVHSSFKGVTVNQKTKLFIVQVRFSNGIKSFTKCSVQNEVDAAKLYDAQIRQFQPNDKWGRMRQLNYPSAIEQERYNTEQALRRKMSRNMSDDKPCLMALTGTGAQGYWNRALKYMVLVKMADGTSRYMPASEIFRLSEDVWTEEVAVDESLRTLITKTRTATGNGNSRQLAEGVALFFQEINAGRLVSSKTRQRGGYNVEAGRQLNGRKGAHLDRFGIKSLVNFFASELVDKLEAECEGEGEGVERVIAMYSHLNRNLKREVEGEDYFDTRLGFVPACFFGLLMLFLSIFGRRATRLEQLIIREKLASNSVPTRAIMSKLKTDQGLLYKTDGAPNMFQTESSGDYQVHIVHTVYIYARPVALDHILPRIPPARTCIS